MIKKCKEMSCIHNRREKCTFPEVTMDEYGYCDSKEQK